MGGRLGSPALELELMDVVKRVTRRAFLSLSALLVVAGSVASIRFLGDGTPQKVLEYTEDYERENNELADLVSQRHLLGESFSLTGYDPDSEEGSRFTRTFLCALGYYGTIDWSVLSAKRVSSVDGLDVPDDVRAKLSEWYGDGVDKTADYQFIVLDVDITNLNAVAGHLENGQEDYWINLNDLRVLPCDSSGNPIEEIGGTGVSYGCCWITPTVEHENPLIDGAVSLPMGETTHTQMIFNVGLYDDAAKKQAASGQFNYALVFDNPSSLGSCIVDLGVL